MFPRYFLKPFLAVIILASCASFEPENTEVIQPYNYDGIPGYSSYAVEPISNPDLPVITSADGIDYTPVIVNPKIPAAYPEQIQMTEEIRSPDKIPAAISWDGKHLWMAGRETGKIYKIVPETGWVLESFPCPGPFPAGLVWQNGGLWLTDAVTNTIYRIEKGKVVKSFPVDWNCIGIEFGDNELIVSEWRSSAIRFVSPVDGAVLRTDDAPANKLWGIAVDDGSIWFSRGDRFIEQDLESGLQINTFSVTEKETHPRGIGDIVMADDYFWFSDHVNGTLVKLRKPENGQHISSSVTYKTFNYNLLLKNTGEEAWLDSQFLVRIPLYEMPGQRFLSYRINIEPSAHYFDNNGNLHALIEIDDFPAKSELNIQVRIDYLSSWRWTYIDPDDIGDSISEEMSLYIQDEYPDDLSLDNSFNESFVNGIITDDENLYWKARKIHDELIKRIDYRDPPSDESVESILKSGSGVCRNFANAYQTLGRMAGVPVVEGWAPHHDLTLIYLPGAGWSFVDITWNNIDAVDGVLAVPRDFVNLPPHHLTANVNGLSLLSDIYIDGTLMQFTHFGRRTPDLPGFEYESDVFAE